MRRFLFGFLWFIVLTIGGFVGVGAVIGALAAARVEPLEGFGRGYEAGRSAGEDFGRKYGALIPLGAIVISIGGSALGILPGTKRKPQR